MKIAEAFVDIKANTKQYEQGVSKVKASLGGLSKMGGAMTGSLLKGGLYVAAAAVVVKSVSSVVNAFNDEEKAVAKLNAVLKATGGASGVTSKEMQDLAQQIQNTSTFSNDAIINGQALLATFTNIKGDNFKEATKMMAEMSAEMGTGLKESAIQLGKALNDPIKGISALSRIGVSFSEAEKKMIKEMVELGKTEEAQVKMLNIMKTQGFEGVAAAMRNTFGGAIKGAKNDLLDLGKAIIKGFSGVGATEGINAFSENIRKATEWIKKLVKTKGWKIFVITLKAYFKILWINIKAPWVLAIALFKDVRNALKRYITGPFTDMIPFFEEFQKGLGIVMKKVSDSFQEMKPETELGKAVKELGMEYIQVGKDVKKAYAEINNIQQENLDDTNNNTNAIKKEADAIKKKIAIEKGGFGSLADSLQKDAFEYANALKESKGGGFSIGSTTSAGVSGGAGGSTGRSGATSLMDVVMAIRETNTILTKGFGSDFGGLKIT